MAYKTLQEAISESKPKVKNEKIETFVIDEIESFLDIYDEQIRRIIKYKGKFDLEIYKDIFLRVKLCPTLTNYSIGEEKIYGKTFLPKKDYQFPLNCYILVSKSDGYNTINWETQKDEFMKNYKQIMKEFMERNKING